MTSPPALPGFTVVSDVLKAIPNPLVNGAVIRLLAVTGLTHRTSYKDIFAVTIIKTAAVFVVIGVYYLTGLY